MSKEHRDLGLAYLSGAQGVGVEQPTNGELLRVAREAVR